MGLKAILLQITKLGFGSLKKLAKEFKKIDKAAKISVIQTNSQGPILWPVQNLAVLKTRQNSHPAITMLQHQKLQENGKIQTVTQKQPAAFPFIIPNQV